MSAPDAQPEPDGGWRQYMPLDVAEREAKAEKIIRALRRAHPLAGARVLEIGTGTGVIPRAIVHEVGPTGHVDSIDTMDTRVVAEGYTFTLVRGVESSLSKCCF